MKNYNVLILVGFFLSIFNVSAQDCEDQNRYVEPMSNTIQRTTVVYATATGYFGETVNLSMDVFVPQGDNTTNRPLIVFAHGGSFVFGSKQDMKELCELYASLGYVTASIDYRKYSIFLEIPDSTGFVDIAFNAIIDMRAAVRYFKADADRENTYNIDADKIFVGGLSAGAIMALHVAILDEEDPQDDEFAAYIASKGGIEGTTGDSINLSYNSEVAGVIGLSGAIFDLDWIDENDPQLLMMHGDIDNVVPHGSDYEGVANLIYLHGSASIHERALITGTSSYFVSVPNGGHTDIYSNAAFATYLETFQENGNTLLRAIICEPGSLSTNSLKISNAQLKFFPNPANQYTILQSGIEGSGMIMIYDGFGKGMSSMQSGNLEQVEINTQSFNPGWYIVQVWKDNSLAAVNRLLIQR
jgi:para-nitrobenzyl esterase